MSAKQIDHDEPGRNMYGVAPCPGCGSKYRWPTRPGHPTHPDSILCDDCGRVEPLESPREGQT